MSPESFSCIKRGLRRSLTYVKVTPAVDEALSEVNRKERAGKVTFTPPNLDDDKDRNAYVKAEEGPFYAPNRPYREGNHIFRWTLTSRLLISRMWSHFSPYWQNGTLPLRCISEALVPVCAGRC